MILLSHPMGNANVRAVAKSFRKVEMLHSFHTSIAVYPGNKWDRLSRMGPMADFRRRVFPGSLQEVTYQYPFGELARMVALKLGVSGWTEHETGRYSVDGIYRSHDRKVANFVRSHSDRLRAVYAYEDGALETFTAANDKGLLKIYDLPIAYWQTGRELMQAEAERRPNWSPTLGGGILDSEEKLARKTRELELADVVVGPGSFVMDSLPEWAKEKRQIVSPFGSPENSKTEFGRRSEKNEKRLSVLFAGSMGQRKGLGDLFEAMKRLDPEKVELVVLGSPLAEMSFYRNEFAGFRYEPTRSHAGVLALMAECDVFCLPSIVEGRALVMQEAMSQGLPIIITPNTGGQDLVIEQETGFLVPIRSPEAIAEKIKWFTENREELPRMGLAASAHAAKYTWSAYGNRIVKEVTTLLT